MKKEILTVAGREHPVYADEEPRFLIVEVVGHEEAATLTEQIRIIKEETREDLVLASFSVEDWNEELSPWEAPPVFGKEGFGKGAKDTLAIMGNTFIPELKKRYGRLPVILCGYSLAGLFALWSAYQTDIFDCVAAVSPSVWFPGWIGYAQENTFHADHVYLSLGDKEEKTRNPIMATVGACIRNMETLLKEKDVDCLLEWNEGNHFKDPERRYARGIISCIRRLARERIRLYHTGFDIVSKPDLKTGRKNADFGQGFYLSDDVEFSKRWARQRRDMTTYLNCYELDRKGLKIKRFRRDQEWFDYIFANRSGKEDVLSGYDVIVGPIANDTIYDTWGVITSGFIPKERALELLEEGPVYEQTVIKTEKGLSALRFLKADILSPEEINSYRDTVRNEEEQFRETFTAKLEKFMKDADR